MTMRRTHIVLALCLVLGACSLEGDTALSGKGSAAAVFDEELSRPANSATAVAYSGVTFKVPTRLPVSEADSYDFACTTFSEDGVFLAPEGEPAAGASCPQTSEYASTIHVQSVMSDDVGYRLVNGAGTTERWVQTTAGHPHQWYEAVLPAYGVMFTFYGIEPEVREAVLSSVEGD